MAPGLPSGSPASHAALPGNNSIGTHLSGGSSVDQDQGKKRGPRDRMADQGYPLLEELVARAKPDINIHAPMKTLLDHADVSAKQADTYLSFKRPDLAYIEYLIASDIVVHLVPRHKDYPSLSTDRGELWRLNKGLQTRINSQHRTFDEVRELIKADNARRGNRPSTTSISETPVNPDIRVSVGTLSLGAVPTPYDHGSKTINTQGASQTELSREAVLGRATDESQPISPRTSISGALKRKPVVVKKSENLRARQALTDFSRSQEEGSSGDGLMERFIRLRVTSPLSSTNRQKSTSVEEEGEGFNRPIPANGSRVSVLESSAFQSVLSEATTPPVVSSLPPSSSIENLPTNGPQGPREMPRKTDRQALLFPSEVSLRLDIQDSMPRPPSPTYNPARNLPTPANIDPPRTTARSMVGTGGRSSSLASARVPIRLQDARPDLLGNGLLAPDSPKTLLQSIPEGWISAQELLEYLKRGSDKVGILLIDVRSREAFDEGHIFAPSVICIEPICLRPGTTAEQIGEASVLSPESEQRLFRHRHTFDIVVCYDECSGDDVSPRRPWSVSTPNYFMSLERALVDYNYEKPLKRNPLLLAGGLDAWINLVGHQALRTSTTAFRSRARKAEVDHVKRYGGIPTREQGIQGELGPHRQQTSRENHVADGMPREKRALPNSVNNDAQFPRTYDDFMRRFPEPSEIKASMVTPSPVLERTILDHPFHNFTGVQDAPRENAPSPSVSTAPAPPLTSAPSRPAPAVPRKSYSGVSERGSYQIPVPSRPPPGVPSHPLPSDTLSHRPVYQIGRTGLTNFGATCYMNAVIQCLSATSPLTRYFLDGSFKGAVQRNNKFGSRGEIPDVYANLMWHLWSGNFTHLSPKSFRETVARLNSDFSDPDVQHDANDFLVFLLDVLHEDLNLNCTRTRLNDLTAADERKREGMPAQVASRVEWNRWAHRNESRVSNLFGGQHLSRLQCPVCGCTSTSYETFYTLPLEIPRTGKAHLYDCLKNYTKEEQLGRENPWTCPNCKVPREATKRITITRAPQILVIQLKRFRTLRRGFNDKNNVFVDFPVTGLDLTPFCVSPLSPSAVQQVENQYGPSILGSADKTIPPVEYNAYGVVQHFGTLHGGHYTSLVRASGGGDQWFEFNDRTINNHGSRHVPTSAAYLLFYVRSKVQ